MESVKSNLATDQRLDPELKAKWVEALRSGKYTQGKDRLQRSGCYCCLGVLQVIHPIPSETDDELLDITEATKLGLNFTAQAVLAAMNDEGRSFEQIADYIEDAL